MDIWRGNPAWLTWQPSMTRWLAQWMKGEQMMFISILTRLSTASHITYGQVNCWNMDQVSKLWLDYQAQRVMNSSTKFSWTPVTSQWLIQGAALFNIFINDTNDGTKSTPSKLVDCRELGWAVNNTSSDGWGAMQRDIDRLEDLLTETSWSSKKGKYKV